jgi:hypothetical protein
MANEELSDEEVRRNLPQRLEKASRRVAMAAFVRGEPSFPEGADNNGTVSFLKLPGGKFLVTNNMCGTLSRPSEPMTPPTSWPLQGKA